jgi:Ca-activated chloride channel family protein
MNENNIVIVGDRHSILEYAIESKVKLVVIVGGEQVKPEHLELAKENNVCVYTVSVGGTDESVGINIQGEIVSQETDINASEVLRSIAETTGGQYYQADSRAKLQQIYSDIDKLEKSKLEKKNYEKKHDAYQIFALLALPLLVMEILVRYVWLRKIP